MGAGEGKIAFLQTALLLEFCHASLRSMYRQGPRNGREWTTGGRTMKTDRVKVAGHTMTYLSEGEGEPVLLVHGITTYSFIWRRVIPLLSHKYRVIAPDLLGCGASEKPLDLSYAIKDHAEYLSGFLDALNIPKVHFVGHDLGGGMGQLLAVRHALAQLRADPRGG